MTEKLPNETWVRKQNLGLRKGYYFSYVRLIASVDFFFGASWSASARSWPWRGFYSGMCQCTSEKFDLKHSRHNIGSFHLGIQKSATRLARWRHSDTSPKLGLFQIWPPFMRLSSTSKNILQVIFIIRLHLIVVSVAQYGGLYDYSSRIVFDDVSINKEYPFAFRWVSLHLSLNQTFFHSGLNGLTCDSSFKDFK